MFCFHPVSLPCLFLCILILSCTNGGEGNEVGAGAQEKSEAPRSDSTAPYADHQSDTTLQQPIGDLIRIGQPLPNSEVTSPLTFSGTARGYYYFEADFPVRLEDRDGNVLAQTSARAGSDWMTEDWVPFSGSLAFNAPDDGRGYLIFDRANPSGLPENARSYRVPVRFPPADQ